MVEFSKFERNLIEISMCYYGLSEEEAKQAPACDGD